MSTTLRSKATTREWIGLMIIALPCIVYSMDLTVLNLAVPRLSADLKPSSSELLWIIDIYGFMVAGMLITMGTLGDRIGRRKLLMIGAASFAITSLIAAFATSAVMLIAARALLGIAGATVAPSTLSLIRNMFPDEKQRTFAIGVWITSYSVGGAIGPFVGGFLLAHYSWQSVFLVSIPVMLLLIVTAPFLLPEYKDPDPGKLDLLSAFQSIVAILAVIFGLKKLAEDGPTTLAFVSIIVGIIFGLLFVRRQQHRTHPLIDLNLFRVRRFNVSLIAYMSGAFVSFGTFIFTAQYLQLVLGLSPLEAGLWTLPWTLGFVAGSFLMPLFLKWMHRVTLMSVSFIFSAIGYLIIMQVDTLPPLVALVAGSMLTSISMVPIFSLTTDFILSSAPPEKTGAASAISETSAEMGGALGIAVLGSFGTAIYRYIVSNSIDAGIPRDIAEEAKDTLAGALTVSERLGQSGVQLRELARQAFTDALQFCVLVSAIVSVILAIVIYLRLRKEKSREEAANAQQNNITPQPEAATV